MLVFRISSFRFGLLGLSESDIPLNLLLFKDQTERKVDFCFHFHIVTRMPQLDTEQWHPKYEKPNLSVWVRDNCLERRLLSINSTNDAYAVYEESDDRNASIFFDKSHVEELNIDTIFISCLALERHFAKSMNGLILHCAYIEYNNKAILFSGPSGIGKSTHAKLWCQRFPGIQIINGDRCLLTKNDRKYYANGWPICGSSQICMNRQMPIASIVFLEQTPDNKIIQTSSLDLYKRLVSQITINYWNPLSAVKSLDCLEKFIREVPACVYGCNMDKDAPIPLKEWIDTFIIREYA